MRIQKPHSALATLSDLVLTLTSIERYPVPIVDETLRQRLAQAVGALREAETQLGRAKIAKRIAVQERKREGRIMIKAVRDFYFVLNRSVQRNPHAQVWLNEFGAHTKMPIDRTPTSQWFELARTIASAGETVSAKLALDKGAFPAPPPSNPSAEEVAATLPSATTKDDAWRDAVAHHKQSEAALIQARKQGKRLLGHVRARLLALFQGLPPEQRHVKMQTYGFRYAAKSREQAHADAEPLATLEAVEVASPPAPAQDDPAPCLISERRSEIGPAGRNTRIEGGDRGRHLGEVRTAARALRRGRLGSRGLRRSAWRAGPASPD